MCSLKCGQVAVGLRYVASHTPCSHPVLEFSLGDSEGRDLALQLLGWAGSCGLYRHSLGGNTELTREVRSRGRRHGQPRNTRNFPPGTGWPPRGTEGRPALHLRFRAAGELAPGPARPSSSCDWWAPWRDQVQTHQDLCPPRPPPSSSSFPCGRSRPPTPHTPPPQEGFHNLSRPESRHSPPGCCPALRAETGKCPVMGMSCHAPRVKQHVGGASGEYLHFTDGGN